MTSRIEHVLAIGLAKTSIDANVFEAMVKQNVGKDKRCTFHEWPNPMFVPARQNCASEGYLMIRMLTTGNATSVVENARAGMLSDDFVSQPLTVPPMSRKRGGDTARRKFVSPQDMFVKRVYGEGVDYHMRYLDGDDAVARAKLLLARHEPWLKTHFNDICTTLVYDDVNPFTDETVEKIRAGIRFPDYILELARMTEWYYIDDDSTKNEPRGVLFVRAFDTDQLKDLYGMPKAGKFARPYLYISVVCSAKDSGMGSKLMQVALNMALSLGLDSVVLSALPNAAGFYYNRFGFDFIDRNGRLVDLLNTPFEGGERDKRTGRGKLLVDADDMTPAPPVPPPIPP
jgi:hypothetical protein